MINKTYAPSGLLAGPVQFAWREARNHFPHLYAVIAAIVVFCFIKYGLGLFHGPVTADKIFYVAVLSILCSGITMKDFPLPGRILVRSVIILFLLYAALHYTSISDALLAEKPNDRNFLIYGKYVAIACGLIGLVRPGAALVLFFFTQYSKELLRSYTGMAITPTDYYNIVEFSVFLVCSLSLLISISKYPKFSFGMKDAFESKSDFPVLYTIILVAISVHYSSYFYSFHAKAVLDANPFYWIYENNTHFIMMVADVYGTLPIKQFETVADLSHLLVSKTWILINILTYFGQLASIFALRRMSWVIILTAFYDLMHITIFLVTGIFFWKWIILNFAIVGALATVRHVKIPMVIYLGLVAIMLLSPAIFFVARLGWYDTASLNVAHFDALTDDGKVVRVPSNYFLSTSVFLAQHRFGRNFEGHFPVGTYGNVKNTDEMKLANRCALPVSDTSEIHDRLAEPKFGKFVRQHHTYVMSQLDEEGHIHYNWYPHHIWSNPALDGEFATLDLRKIREYRYTVESVCLKFVNRKVEAHTQLKGTYVFDL